MDVNTLLEKIKNLDSIGKLSLIRWALLVFAVIMIFIGEHSLIQFVKRGTQIREVEAQIEHTNQQIRQAQRSMNMLDDIDSLERFARERYMMHTDKEDVYIVEP